MMNRRTLLAALALFGALVGVPASAFEAKPFDPAAFEAAKAAGKPVLVEVSAPWCPVCKAQKPILSTLSTKQKFKDYVVFEVDFDSKKDVLRTLNVQKQSTLIAYSGTKEVGRSTGDTDAASIEALLAKAI